MPACVKTCPSGAMNFGDRDKMTELARKRLEEIKPLYPKAELLNSEFVRTIFLVIDDPKKYHKFAGAEDSRMTASPNEAVHEALSVG